MYNGAAMRDSEKYAILANVLKPEEMREGTRVDHSEVGAYRTKAIRAGEFIYIRCYPLISTRAAAEQSAQLLVLDERKKHDRIMLAKWNAWNNARRAKELEQLVHAAFTKGDLHISCTYALEEYEGGRDAEFTREDAKREIRNYIRRVRRLLERHGCDLNQFWYLCVTVTKKRMTEAAQPWPERHHHHILMHGVPDDLRNAVEGLWPHGYCNADRMRDSKEGLSAIAGYIARQENCANGEGKGEKSYTTSRNIPRPVVMTSDQKLSRRRAARIAADVRADGKEIFEKLYPDYRLVEDIKVDVSDFTAGAYIYAKLRRRGDADIKRGKEKTGQNGSARGCARTRAKHR